MPGAFAASVFTSEFLKELPSDAAARAKALGITVPQGVTVASLVEQVLTAWIFDSERVPEDELQAAKLLIVETICRGLEQ